MCELSATVYLNNHDDIRLLSSFYIFTTGKVCDNPLLYNEDGFPDSVFTGSGDSSNKYKDARITKGGWCPSNYSTAHLLLDLQKEHHIKQVVVMADKEQTQWSGSYSLEYSRDPFLYNSLQVCLRLLCNNPNLVT